MFAKLIKNKEAWFRVSLVTTILLAIAEIALLLMYRETWVDEQIYLFKSLVILRGDFVPFGDILVEYPPAFILIYGLPQLIFGAGFYVGRLTAVLVLVICLILFFKLAEKLSSRWLALGSVIFLLSNVLLIGNYISVSLYAPSLLVMLVMVYTETLSIKSRSKIIIAGICGALLILIRINLVPVVIVYLAYLIWQKTSLKQVSLFVGVFAAVVILGYLPIVLSNPTLAISYILSPFHVLGPLKALPTNGVSSPGLSSMLLVLAEFIKEYLIYLALFLAVAFAFVKGLSKEVAIRQFLIQEKIYVFVTVLGVALIATHYFYWRIAGNLYYANYFIPILVLSAIIGTFKFTDDKSPWVLVLIVGIILNFGANILRTDVVSSPNSESDLTRVERGAAFVKANTQPTDTVVAFDNSIFQVYLAGRKTYPQLINRDFYYLGGESKEVASSLLMYNFDMLTDWIKNSDYLVLHEESWPVMFRRAFWKDNVKVDGRLEIEKLLKDRFTLVGTEKNVYPRKYTEGNDGGTLLLYKRIK
ncbi:MAG: glycosyltransferase family 39 protein [Candidatus Paceibacterota bacterium]|jgi:4-amino-4-deoxy-L-arabinose transferase-like glycosyltransferase